MGRADGKRTRGVDLMYELVPHIMPLRYDASNYIKQDIDLEPIQAYIRKCRRNGVSMSHMSVIIAGYLRAVSQNPFLNRFVVNKKIYARNHFCISFVTLVPGSNTNTVSKVYFNLDDDILTVNEKINKAIEKSQNPNVKSSLDRLMISLCRIPFLLGTAVGILRLMDRYGLLPRFLLDASPFHTSLFITNLASIRTGAIYHHLYQFGTTSIFVSMGQPQKKVTLNGETVEEKKVMELGIVTDERIADGHYYGRCFKELKRFYKNPELLETKPEAIFWDPDVKGDLGFFSK